MRKLAYCAFGSVAASALLLGGAASASAHGMHHQGGAEAEAVVANSPGVVSGNNVQVPIHIPVNICGNTVDVVGLLNPAFGNSCANVS